VAFAALVVTTAPLPAVAASEIVTGDGTEFSVEVGKGRLIKLDRPATTVFIADPEVADVVVKSPTLVYLVGKAPGGTTLYAIDASERVVLNANVSVGFDETRLERTLRELAPDSDIDVSSVNDSLVLSGEVSSAQTGEEILRIARRFVNAEGNEADSWIINQMTLNAPNQVNLRVRVAEVSQEARQQLGFNWAGIATIGDATLALATGRPIFDAAGNLLRAAEGGSILGGITSEDVDINLLVDALEDKGLITILAEPNLTALSGEPANFLAGGEYPIPVPQSDERVTIEYKRFGVSLSFVPTILASNRISLKVTPEVSQLSTAGAITLNNITVPALTTRRAETTVEMASGQSFAIAGLLQNTVSEDIEKFPGLGDLPIIGNLFRSRSLQENKSELVIIVTPYLVEPVSHRLATPLDPPIHVPEADPGEEQLEETGQ
jgi:pilus assembly protein CpaC